MHQIVDAFSIVIRVEELANVFKDIIFYFHDHKPYGTGTDGTGAERSISALLVAGLNQERNKYV